MWLEATKALLCVDLVCSYPLVLQAGRKIIETALVDQGGGGRVLAAVGEDEAQRTAVRVALVAATACIAQWGDFGALISLVGGSCQVLLAFAAPPALALALGQTSDPARRLANRLVLPAGVIVAVGTALVDLGAFS